VAAAPAHVEKVEAWAEKTTKQAEEEEEEEKASKAVESMEEEVPAEEQAEAEVKEQQKEAQPSGGVDDVVVPSPAAGWQRALLPAKDRLTEIRNRRLRKRMRAKRGSAHSSSAAAAATPAAAATSTPPSHLQKHNGGDDGNRMGSLGTGAAIAGRRRRRTSSRLPKLPSRYARLLRLFRGLEAALNVALSRRPAHAHYDGLKLQVERTARAAFTLADLGRILAVYPDAYRCFHEDPARSYNSADPAAVAAAMMNAWAPKLLIRFGEGAPRAEDSRDRAGKSHYLAEAILVPRQREFEDRIVERVAECHRGWLERNDPSITEADLEELPGDWHFKFEAMMDKIVPPITPVKLPDPPKLEKTDKDKARAQLLSSIRAEKKGPSEEALKKEKEFLEKNGVPSHLKGIDLGLLAKVRLRDAYARTDRSLGGPELREKLKMTDRLPYITDLIRTCLRARNRRAMKILELVPLLIKSHRNRDNPPTRSEVTSQISMLAEIAPEFCTIKTLGAGKKILKVNLKFPVVKVKSAVAERRKTEQKALDEIEKAAQSVHDGMEESSSMAQKRT